MIWPTMEELEEMLFRLLQEQFAAAMTYILEDIDRQIMEQRDKKRYRLKNAYEIDVDTLFGTVTFKRRIYLDRQTGKHVYLLDQMLQYDGQKKISPCLEEVAVAFASQGPSYRDSADRLEKLLGYRPLSHEAIRGRLISEAETLIQKPVKRKAPPVLFIEADGLYTKLQRTKAKGIEHRIAIVHEGWEKEGGRICLKEKKHYLHERGDFWEGLGRFLSQHYELDGDTWLVVNGDGAPWIKECQSYFHRCIFQLDRFHVARELRNYVGHLPGQWRRIRKALAEYDVPPLLSALEQVADTDIPTEKRTGYRQYVRYLQRNQDDLRDYREVLRQAGLDTTGMRPMGSAEAQMRVMAKRTKRGGYSWSKRGIRAMLKAIIRFKEGWDNQAGIQRAAAEKTDVFREANMKQLLQEVQQTSQGCLNGVIRLLKGPMQSSPTGMALKGLRGF
ncbi:ISLre2 family transposase [Novibacillus thermophilus]|uniref:ISLre2 family transposase n=2 Tax=Novibacillus thermophilus TaxID=1471761 RepID=A0A1U9KBQ4_9BACL|nr:ISLre2 family transposase [Novibacillus thermophilus]AQS57478.1 ISLre2 family transposase [Novibacillus thermophilus]